MVGSESRAPWISTRLGTGKYVLDIGCRDGTLTNKYAASNTVVGVDIDAEALRLAKANYGFETHQINLNNGSLPFPDSSFDAVIAGEVLEHLQFPDTAVIDIHRVLKPAVTFIGSVPNAFRLRNRLDFLLGREFEKDPTHLHHFSPAGLKRLLAGFRDVELDFLESRYRWFSKRLMATQMMFAAQKS